MKAVTKELLHELCYYMDGELFWKEKKYRRKMNVPIGHVHHTGYKAINFRNKFYYLHRLVWLYHHGFLPPVLDHIDGNPLNNRVENLRVATRTQNAQNRKLNANSSTGVKGLCFYKKYNKWKAQLGVNGKYVYLGWFSNFDEAVNAINRSRADAHGTYARFK